MKIGAQIFVEREPRPCQLRLLRRSACICVAAFGRIPPDQLQDVVAAATVQPVGDIRSRPGEYFRRNQFAVNAPQAVLVRLISSGEVIALEPVGNCPSNAVRLEHEPG